MERKKKGRGGGVEVGEEGGGGRGGEGEGAWERGEGEDGEDEEKGDDGEDEEDGEDGMTGRTRRSRRTGRTRWTGRTGKREDGEEGEGRKTINTLKQLFCSNILPAIHEKAHQKFLLLYDFGQFHLFFLKHSMLIKKMAKEFELAGKNLRT